MSVIAFRADTVLIAKDGRATREGLALFQALLDRTGGSGGVVDAGSVSFTPTGSVGAVNVQSAIAELDGEKASTASLALHTGNTSNPHNVTKAQVGLGNVDDTSDADKPVSDATQAALDLKKDIASLGTMAEQNADSVAITGGDVLLASGALGFATGNGGSVAQLTSKATDVSLDAMCGAITLHNAALAANTVVSFDLVNTNIDAQDIVIAVHNSAGTNGAYLVMAQVLSGGAARISVRNLTAGSLSEAIVIRFAVIKAATS